MNILQLCITVSSVFRPSNSYLAQPLGDPAKGLHAEFHKRCLLCSVLFGKFHRWPALLKACLLNSTRFVFYVLSYLAQSLALRWPALLKACLLNSIRAEPSQCGSPRQRGLCNQFENRAKTQLEVCEEDLKVCAVPTNLQCSATPGQKFSYWHTQS